MKKAVLAVMCIITAPAAANDDFFIAVGKAEYHKANNGDWRYDPLPHRIEGSSNAYKIGFQGEFKPWLQWRSGFNNFGQASMTAQNVGDEWLGCYEQGKNCRERQVDFSTSRTKSLSVELIPTFKVNDFSAYIIGGLHYFQTKTEISHHHSRNMIVTSGDVKNEEGNPRIDIHQTYAFEKKGFASFYGLGVSYRQLSVEIQFFGRTQMTDSPFRDITTLMLNWRMAI